MEDLIRRSDAIKAIEALECFGYIECKTKGLVKDINAIPSAESTGDLDNAIYEYVQDGLMSNPYDRPQGEWIHDYHFGLALPEHKCSVCGEWEYSDTESNYCPNCGARMKGADDEDN